jgi:hypothetical protein
MTRALVMRFPPVSRKEHCKRRATGPVNDLDGLARRTGKRGNRSFHLPAVIGVVTSLSIQATYLAAWESRRTLYPTWPTYVIRGARRECAGR